MQPVLGTAATPKFAPHPVASLAAPLTTAPRPRSRLSDQPGSMVEAAAPRLADDIWSHAPGCGVHRGGQGGRWVTIESARAPGHGGIALLPAVGARIAAPPSIHARVTGAPVAGPSRSATAAARASMWCRRQPVHQRQAADPPTRYRSPPTPSSRRAEPPPSPPEGETRTAEPTARSAFRRGRSSQSVLPTPARGSPPAVIGARRVFPVVRMWVCGPLESPCGRSRTASDQPLSTHIWGQLCG
jgi:hypothetical protein